MCGMWRVPGTSSVHKYSHDSLLWCTSAYCTLETPGVVNILASLGHTGRRGVVLGHTLNTQTLMKTDEQKKSCKWIYDFVLVLIYSHPGPHAVRGPRVGHPWLWLLECQNFPNPNQLALTQCQYCPLFKCGWLYRCVSLIQSVLPIHDAIFADVLTH